MKSACARSVQLTTYRPTKKRTARGARKEESPHVDLSNFRITTYVTHGHDDHFFGIGTESNRRIYRGSAKRHFPRDEHNDYILMNPLAK